MVLRNRFRPSAIQASHTRRGGGGRNWGNVMRCDEEEIMKMYSEVKGDTIYFLDSANIRIAITFDDVMCIASIFVIFAEDLRQMYCAKSSDSFFEGIYSICFFAFIIELLLRSWARSTVSVRYVSYTKWKKKRKEDAAKHQRALSGGGGSSGYGPNTNFKRATTGRANSIRGQKPPLMKPPTAQPKLKLEQMLSIWPLKVDVKGYFLSLFFLFDLLTIISLIPDIEWLSEAMGFQWGENSHWNELRMVRLIRLVRLYTIMSHKGSEEKIAEELDDLINEGVMDEAEGRAKLQKVKILQRHRQSKVGAALSKSIIRRVVVGILIMLVLVPLLTYDEQNIVNQYSVERLQEFNLQTDSMTLDYAAEEMISNLGYYESGQPNLIFLAVQGETVNTTYVDRKRSQYRSYELEEYTEATGPYVTKAIFSRKPILQVLALYDLILTIFVCGMMSVGVAVFNSDARKLVLAPIERMMETIEYMAVDPLQEDLDIPSLTEQDSNRNGEYEMRLLETTITKITGLLRVGFGVAGAEIISKNLRIDDTSSSVLEVMIPGKRVYAIFGFCDIHRFELITDCLQGEVMTFVNSVAAIVHGATTAWAGQCNKNLGNSFLIVWRIGDAEEVLMVTELVRIDAKRAQSSGAPSRRANKLNTSGTANGLISPSTTGGGNLSSPARNSTVAGPPAAAHNSDGVVKAKRSVNLRRVPGVEVLADKALVAFLKVIYAINTDPVLKAYESRKELSNAPGGFKLSMGFGLHTGWAIEGAVGSIEKVDATYLSPHVNMAARMETASRQYKVPLLMTDDFYQLLSQEGQHKCRKLDVVTVKGSAVPIPVYTYDAAEHILQLAEVEITDEEYEEEWERQADMYSANTWTDDYQMLCLRSLVTHDFYKTHSEGVKYYIAGDWALSRRFLDMADLMMLKAGKKDGDGPSRVLLSFMSNRNFKCPAGWMGYRELTSK